MRKFMVVFLSLMLAFSASAALAEPTNNEIVFVCSEEITGTDIQMITWENLVHRLLYSSMIVMDETASNPVSNLVTEISIENDGKDLVFTIPEGICFSNGDPVTGQAIVDNFTRYREVSIYSSDLDPVSSIEADGNTVTFHCEQAAPYLWAVLATTYSGIDNVAAIEDDNAFNMAAVTYGPYRVESWDQGQQITLVRNEYYQGNNYYAENRGTVYPDKVTVRFISDDYTRVNELISGNVDWIEAVPASNLEELRNTPGVVIAETYQAGVDYLLLNTKDPVLSDYNVRMAINKAINREELCAALNNTVITAQGFLSPSQIGYSAESAAELGEKYSYDPEGAAQLLADAGWADTDGDGILDKDGQKLSFEFLSPNDYTALKNAAPVLQYQLKQVGIDLQISEMESAVTKTKAQEGTYQIAARKYSWSDADMLVNLFGTSSRYYSDETIDALLEDARYETDGALRAEKYALVQDEIYNQLPGIPLFYEIQYSAYSDKIQGVKYTSTGSLVVDDLYKAD